MLSSLSMEDCELRADCMLVTPVSKIIFSHKYQKAQNLPFTPSLVKKRIDINLLQRIRC